MKTTIQKATYTGKKTGVLLEVESADYFNDGFNNPNITVEGTAPCRNKRRITLTLMAPKQPLAGQKRKLVEDILKNLGGLNGGGITLGDLVIRLRSMVFTLTAIFPK